MKDKKIAIWGIGALGSNLTAMLAADMHDLDITVIDFDTVESRNIQAGTQFFYPDQIGLPKTEAIQYNVYKLLSGKRINVLTEQLAYANSKRLIAHYSTNIDCMDNHDARELIDKASKQFKVPCLHAGFSPSMTFSVEWGENYQVPDDDLTEFDICTVEGAASFIKMVAAITSTTAQEFLTNKTKRNFVGNRLSVREMV